MQYRLRFIDSIGQTVRELRIETDSDDTAINYSSNQSICFNMPVELWRADELVARTTPMTAQLYLDEEKKRKLPEKLALR